MSLEETARTVAGVGVAVLQPPLVALNGENSPRNSRMSVEIARVRATGVRQIIAVGDSESGITLV
jgi:hypothetical protein